MREQKAGQRQQLVDSQNKAEGHEIKLKVFIDFGIDCKLRIASDKTAILKMQQNMKQFLYVHVRSVINVCVEDKSEACFKTK